MNHAPGRLSASGERKLPRGAVTFEFEARKLWTSRERLALLIIQIINERGKCFRSRDRIEA